MRRLLFFIVITAMGMGQGLAQSLIQTYTDRCTGATQVFTVPMNGSTVVAFYNRSRTFTSQDFQNGTLQAWLEETYLWWTSLSPCSTTQTGATATQQTTQQTTQQATQAASNAAASAASTAKVEVPVTPPATTNPTTNASPAPSSPPTTTETSTPPPADTSTANNTASTESQPTGGTDNASTGNNDTGSGTSETSSTETQSSSEQSDTSSTETTESTNETTESTSSEDTSTEDSSTETSNEDSSTEETSTDESTETEDVEENTTEESTEESNESETEESTEESTEEETTEEDTTEEESTEEESTEEESENEESDEESSEEESDEESEEDSEEETDEEESDDDESEEDEEEDTEEESNDEDEEEDGKKKKKKRALAPPVVMANMLSQQGPDGRYTQAAMFGVSQSSLLGTETYGINGMVYSNLQQFMLTANYSKVHINDEGRVNRVYSGSLGVMKMFTTYMTMMNHSMVWMGKKGTVAGLAFGTNFTSVELDIRKGLVYYDTQILGTSLTGFATKPFNFDRLTISPMLAVSSPFMSYDTYYHSLDWNTDVMIIGGSSFTYRLTQRFGINFGVNVIEATIKDFPTLKTFTIGGRLSF